jgi:hypothetical protein
VSLAQIPTEQKHGVLQGSSELSFGDSRARRRRPQAPPRPAVEIPAAHDGEYWVGVGGKGGR